MTTNEIIRASECCAEWNCSRCPLTNTLPYDKWLCRHQLLQMIASHFGHIYTKDAGCEHDTSIGEVIVGNTVQPFYPTQRGVHENKTCNKCGKPLDIWDVQEDFSWNSRLGYGTKYDGCDLQLHLCCSCMEKLIDECAVSPIKENT